MLSEGHDLWVYSVGLTSKMDLFCLFVCFESVLFVLCFFCCVFFGFYFFSIFMVRFVQAGDLLVYSLLQSQHCNMHSFMSDEKTLTFNSTAVSGRILFKVILLSLSSLRETIIMLLSL